MSHLLIKPQQPDDQGCVINVTPQSAGWQCVGFSVHQLSPGAGVQSLQAQRETCVVILTGTVDVVAGEYSFAAIGIRHSVFEDISPAAVYVPANTAIEITARTPAQVALCTAPGANNHPPRLISEQAINQEIRGAGTNLRKVRGILPQTEAADSLLIFEVITPGGNWSSYPPHKHDSDRIPQESALEETYYHLLNPSQGFAFQRVYTDDRSLDETMSVEHGDCVLVPKGYHPVGAAHGYDLYYLNVMAGPRRQWIFHNDPAHEWMLE